MTTAATSQPSVEATIAGFIVWLAHRHSPLINRQRYATAVERFLRWQREQRTQDQPSCTEDAYCAQMRRCGASDAQVSETRTAIGVFRHYLITAD